MTSKAKAPPANAQPCEALGETWWLSELTPRLRKLYGTMIRGRARQQLIDEKSILSEADYEEAWDRFQGRVDAGAYEWGPPVEIGGTGAGKAIRAAFDSNEHTTLLIQMLLAEAHGELSVQRIGEIVDANPEGIQAALRAVQGLPPLAVAPDGEPAETPGSKTEKTAATAETPKPATSEAAA